MELNYMLSSLTHGDIKVLELEEFQVEPLMDNTKNIEELFAELKGRGLKNYPISLQQAIVEREQLQQQNYQLQHKLAEYFRKKKADESRQDYDKNVTDQEQRYLKYMGECSTFNNYGILFSVLFYTFYLHGVFFLDFFKIYILLFWY